jgi:hypothetical protein
VLLISGVASAFAASPAPPAPVTTAPVTQPAADPATEPVEATDTDTLQEGDQTTPDVPGAAEAPEAADAAEPAEAKDAAEAPEAKGTEADGPGGHADPEGQNIDHQFEGEE